MTAPAQTPILPLGPRFEAFEERIRTEREERLTDGKKMLSFGVRFLDAALGGIATRDMILLGAKTGLGKTTLASLIAESNAEKGKHVHYFALEAEPKEIERRIKFRALAFVASQRSISRSVAVRMNYLDWHSGKIDHLTRMWESAADEYVVSRYKTLHTFYRTRDFTAEDMEKAFLSIQDQTDLIVLDHLHMIDSDDTNENRAYKVLVKKLRDIALELGKPVVIVAHLRKGDRRSKAIIPELDDFHGTSDVSKLVTKAILIAPAYDQENALPHLWKTYIHPAKCRPEGSRTRFVGLAEFNVITGRYESDFQLGRMINAGEKFESLTVADYPPWAREQSEANR